LDNETFIFDNNSGKPISLKADKEGIDTRNMKFKTNFTSDSVAFVSTEFESVYVPPS